MNFEPILYGPLFVRDAPDINLVASGADPVELTVATGGSSWPLPVTPVLTDGRYLAPLRMREILDSVVGIPGLADAGEREVPLVTLTAEGTSMSLRAVYGGAAGKTPTELAGHWLSWRDQVSKTYAWGRERLTFLAGRDLLGWRSGSYSVKAKVYLASGDPVTVTLASGTLSEGCRYVTVDASYAAIAALVSGTIRAWDVSYSFSGRDSGNANASLDGFPLRLVLARQDVRVKEFVFCNSFGVEDRVYSSGRSNPKLEGASVAFLNGAVEQELRNDATEGREVFSGYLGSARESALWLDFLKAHERHILLSRGLARIIVDTQETDLQDNAIGSVKFTYHLGALDAGRHFDDLEGLGEYDPAQRYGALYVGDEPASEDLPTEDLFFLKTRLDEFPAADLDEDLLFLVQNPLTQAWGNASLNSIKEYLQQVITREDVRVWTGPWTDYSAGVAGYALSAGLGRDLYDRIRNIETHPTDLSNYYTKSQTDAAILAGIAGKVNADDLKSLTLNVGSAVVGTYNPIGSSDQTLTISESNLTALLDDNYHPLHGEHDASAEKYFWIGGAKFIWHPAVGGTDGYLELQSAIVTTGDQIVISGTPGGSGGGGGAGYIYELKDTLSTWIGRPAVSEMQVLVFDPSADVRDKNENVGAWKYVNASSIGGVTSVVGQTGAVTAAQIATALTSAGYKLTDHEYSNGYGLNLSNGEFSLTQAVRNSLGLANTALQAANIKTLTLNVGSAVVGTYNPIGSSDQPLTISESNLTALLDDNYHPLHGEHDASAEKYFWIGGAKFIWHPAVGGTDGYLELQSAIVTGGDQIVISGTPGQGGGGGGAGYLYELGDVYHDNDKTVVLRPNNQPRGNGDVLSFDSALGVWVALQKSTLLSGYALESYVDSEIWDSIQALNLGAASTYGVGTVASGNGGLVTGGSVYSAINEAVSSVLKMQGTTTTAISDGGTTNPIVIDGSSYTAKKGDVVMYRNKEFWWTGSAWEELGDEASWALKTTTISAGQGLTGGGTLAANRTISLNSATIASLALADTAYQKPSGGIPNSDIATPWVKVGTTQINLGGQQTSLAGLVNVAMSGKLTIGSAEIEWVAGENGNPGYLKINQALLTTGDQIVNSGTPGQGGGGSVPYLHELQDVTITNVGTGNLLQWNGSAWVNVAANTVGVTTLASASAPGLMSASDYSKLYNIEANANNYSLPLADNGTRGGIQVGFTTSAANRNYAVQLSSEKAYVNVPWVEYSAGTAANVSGADTTAKVWSGSVMKSAIEAYPGVNKTGTVTEVKMTVPTGLSVSGSPITTSGTLAVTFATGYSIPTTAKQSNWDTAYGWGNHASAGYLLASTAQSTYQPLDDDLTAIAALTGPTSGQAFLKRNSDNTWVLDTNTYLTGNQTITLSGDVSGSGTTSIQVSIGTGKVTNAMLAGSIANGKLANSSITVGTTAISLGGSATSLAGLVNVSMSGKLTIGSAEIEWVAGENGNPGYLKVNQALLTVGDQIVNSGTPGGGGGGGGAGFLYELGDVLTDSGHTVVKQYDGSTNAANNNLFAFNGSKWYALKLGSNLAISSGTLNATDTTYSNGTGLALSNGVFSITSAYQTNIANGASAYSTLTTSQNKNKVLASPSNASGAPSFRALVAADLPSIENLTNFSTRVYDATTSRTANYVLAAPNGSDGAATFRKLVAADIPSLTVSKISDIASNYVSIATANTITAKHTFSNGILLNTASSWTSSDRAIAFSADGEDANIRYYNTDSNKGLTFNPNTGELKAAKFTRRGGISSQFLKADGSVDSNTYLTGNQTITLSGDVSGSGTTSINVSIGSGKVTNAMLAGSIAWSKLSVSASNITSTLGTTAVSRATADADGNTISSTYVKKVGDTMTGDLIIEKTGGGLTIRGERLNSNANGGYIYLAGRYYDNDRNGVKIAAEYPGSVGYDIQDLVIYTSYNHSGNASPVWQEAMRIAAQGQTFINGQYTYSLYIDNVASDATSTGIRFRTGGTTVGGIFVNSSNDLYFAAGTSSSGAKILTASNYDGYALPLAGGTMTGSIKLTNGTYINAESGYAMCGIGSGGETFYCGPGAEITNAFYLRSGNINLTHVKAGTNYTIWDASNTNLSTVDWAANNLTVAGTSTFSDTMYVENRKYMYWKDSGGTSRNVFGLNNTDSLLIGYGLTSVTGSVVAIYGETVRLNTGMTELVQANGATLMLAGTGVNTGGSKILFRSSNTSDQNGFKIEAEAAASSSNRGRLALNFFTSNNTTSPYAPDWKRAMRISYNGNIMFGNTASGSEFYPTVYSYGPLQVGSSTTNKNLTVYGSITSSGDQVISSDASLKKNWRDLKYGVADIAKATAGVFDWKDGKGESAGTKAQDWMHLVPQLVHGEEGHMTLAYGQIAMLNTILLARRSEDHETRIKALELENAELRKEIERLRS